MAATLVSRRLVGRDAELAALREALAGACAGRPALAFVAGESGVGKSRLLDELTAEARAAGARVLRGECVELGEGELPYAPLVAALRPLARGGDPALLEMAPAARATLAALLPDLADGAPAPAGEAQPLMFEALLTALARLAEPAPLVLVVEDLHWADRSTRDVLAFLARNLGEERLLLALSYRPDELHRRHPLRPLLATLERASNAVRVELAGLDRAGVAALAAELLGAPPAPELVERVHRRSEGNPLFVEELIASGSSGPLPPSLAEALLLRVERLPAGAQEVARVLAAVQPADHALLEELVALDGAALHGALRDAVAGHVVAVGEDDRYAFRHVLLREVVYDDLLPGERAALHAAVARALEDRHARGPGDTALAAAIAHHHHAAGAQPEALRWAVAAAEVAVQMHAAGGAATLLERALELWDRVPEAEAIAGIDHVELLRRAAVALHRSGHEGRALALVDEALREARAHDLDDPRVPTLLRQRSWSEWSLGRGEASRRSLELAQRLLADDAPAHERVEILLARAKLAMMQSRYAESCRLAEELLAGELTAAQRASLSTMYGAALIGVGEHDRGVALLREAMAEPGPENPLNRICVAYINLADGLHLRGRSDEASAIAAEGLDRLPPGVDSRAWLVALGAELAIDRGEHDRARALLGELGRRSGSTRANIDLRRAELALAEGDETTARAALDDAGALLGDSLEPQLVAVAGALRAELERRAGNLGAAREAVEAALERVEFCSDDTVRIARLAAAGAAVEADAAQRARDLGDGAEARAAGARAAAMLDRARAAAAGQGPVEQALLLQAEAERSRAAGEADPEPWRSAAEAWAALGRPLCEAAARAAAAEACLASGARDGAAEAAGAALAIARRLGARHLVTELERLTARARLALEAPAGAREDAGAGEEPGEDPFGLTARERQVLGLVARGATNREVGAELFMAEKTASVHVSRILAKLGVRSRTEAAAVAHRLGLASGTPDAVR